MNIRLGTIARALRHRNYRLFFSGQLISMIGTWMQNVAQAWLVYRLSHSAFLLGLTGFANQIPIFLLAPIGGHAADRWSRHRIVVLTQTSSMVLALMLAALTFAHTIAVWHVIVLATLLGAINAFDVPARQSFIVEMVGREDLPNAIALNSSLVNGARILGPAVAGVLVAALGEAWCFFANGVSYLAVITGLLLMRLEARERPPQTGSAAEHIAQGFRWIRATRPIYALLLQLGLISLVGAPYMVLMPVFADRVLHSGAAGLGALMGATGIGALVGALGLASRTRTRGLGRVAAYAAFGFGLSLMLFAQSRIYALSLVLLVPVGFCFIMQMASTNTLLQSMVPDQYRGRVMAAYSMMFMGMTPVGALLAGTAATHFGAPLTVTLGGAIACAGSIVFRARWRRMHAEVVTLLKAQHAPRDV